MALHDIAAFAYRTNQYDTNQCNTFFTCITIRYIHRWKAIQQKHLIHLINEGVQWLVADDVGDEHRIYSDSLCPIAPDHNTKLKGENEIDIVAINDAQKRVVFFEVKRQYKQ